MPTLPATACLPPLPAARHGPLPLPYHRRLLPLTTARHRSPPPPHAYYCRLPTAAIPAFLTLLPAATTCPRHPPATASCHHRLLPSAATATRLRCLTSTMPANVACLPPPPAAAAPCSPIAPTACRCRLTPLPQRLPPAATISRCFLPGPCCLQPATACCCLPTTAAYPRMLPLTTTRHGSPPPPHAYRCRLP
ncbi:hypothetical protein GH733_016338, partial [Mirounga leonina]